MDTIAEILDLQRTQNTGTEKGKRTSNMMLSLLSFFKSVAGASSVYGSAN